MCDASQLPLDRLALSLTNVVLMIMHGLLAIAKKQGLVAEQHVDSMFSLHQAVQAKLSMREISCRVGGPCEINLHDMTKVKDVLEATCEHQTAQHCSKES